MSTTAMTFEEFLAAVNDAQDPTRESVAIPDTWDERSATMPLAAMEFPELFEQGNDIEGAEPQARFEGVRQDLVREIRGGMCTREQALAYLQNFELYLLGEAEKLA